MSKMSGVKTRTYEGNLYRADAKTTQALTKASNNYKNAPMKYFTLNKREVNTYTRYGKPFVKTWQTTDKLNLVDILDLKTRKALEDVPNIKKSINIAFPIKNNKVMRISEEDTQDHDDVVLKIICGLGYDGYYMETLTEPGYKFHSEVGLCPRAFDKLELVEVERKAPPETKKKGTKSFSNRKHNNVTNRFNRFTRSNSRVNTRKNKTSRALFSMSNNNNNTSNSNSNRNSNRNSNNNSFLRRPLF